MIHADARRAALERWLYEVLRAELRGASFALTPASEDASFRRYFRATLDTAAASSSWMHPPGRRTAERSCTSRGCCMTRVCMRPKCMPRTWQAGFLLLSDLGTRTYLAELDSGNATC